MSLEHIEEKLRRAHEQIVQIDQEVVSFLGESPKRSLVDYDAQSAAAFEEFHRQRAVPIRLSVLTGEVLYQLRSSLDHLVCDLIERDGGAITRRSQFPIVLDPERGRQEFERRIAGITRPAVRKTIEGVQPYHRELGSGDHWLSILQTFSNRDKHRTLVLHVVRTEPRLSIELLDMGDGTRWPSDQADDGTDSPILGSVLAYPDGQRTKVVDVKRRLRTSVAFAEWGKKERPVELVEGLNALLGGVRLIAYRLRPFL